MCGGGRGESGPLKPEMYKLFSDQYCQNLTQRVGLVFFFFFFNWTNKLFICAYILNAVAQWSGTAVLLVGARRQSWPHRPLTVSLIFCPMLSCRVSGMSLICFLTWHAASPCTTYFACPRVRKTQLTLECNTLHSCYLLATLLVSMSTTGHAVQHSLSVPTHTAQ